MLFNWLTEVEKWLVIGQFCSWLLFFFSQDQVFYLLNFVFVLFLVFVI